MGRSGAMGVRRLTFRTGMRNYIGVRLLTPAESAARALAQEENGTVMKGLNQEGYGQQACARSGTKQRLLTAVSAGAFLFLAAGGFALAPAATPPQAAPAHVATPAHAAAPAHPAAPVHPAAP